MSSTTDAKNQTLTYEYKNNGWLWRKKYPDNTYETYSYDANGNVLTMTNPAVTMTYSYTDRNQVQTITTQSSDATFNKTVSYTYDVAGRKKTLTYPDGEVLTYQRDARGQVSDLTTTDPAGTAVHYAYTPTGGLDTATYGFGMTQSRTYDPATGRLTRILYKKPDQSTISDFTYTYYNDDNIATKMTEDGVRWSYAYNSRQELTQAIAEDTTQNPAGVLSTENFAYDALGNRTWEGQAPPPNGAFGMANRSQSSMVDGPNIPVWQHNEANQLIAYGSGIFDPNGNTAPTTPMMTYTYDENGLMLTKTDPMSNETDYYTWNQQGLLASVSRGQTLMGAKKIADYTYGNALRLSKKLYHPDGTVQKTIWYCYGMEGLLAEYEQNGTQYALMQTYAWHPDSRWGTHPLWQHQTFGTTTPSDDKRLFFINDILFTPQKAIDSSFTPHWSANRFSYGGFREITGDTTLSHGFPGQFLDNETGLFYNFHRYYDASLGRYISSDPIGLAGGMNRYVYTKSNPINLYDHSGLKLFRCQKPLHSLWGANGRKQLMDVWGNPLYHEYLCVDNTCGGQDRTGAAFGKGSPGKPSSGDVYDSKFCDEIPLDSKSRCCVEDCVKKIITSPTRPCYAIGPLGTDCQEFVENTLVTCYKRCKIKWFYRDIGRYFD